MVVVGGRAEGRGDAGDVEGVGVGEVRANVVEGHGAGGAAFSTVALYDAAVLHVVDVGDAGGVLPDLWSDDGGASVQRAEYGVALIVHAELADPYGLEAGNVKALEIEADVGLGAGAVDLVWTVDVGIKGANVLGVVGDHRLAEGHELCHSGRTLGGSGGDAVVVPF